MCVCVCVCLCECSVAQLCPTLHEAMDGGPPGYFVHGISRQETGVGCYLLIQGISLIQRWNLHLLCLLHWQVDSLATVPPGKPPLNY